MSNLFPHVIRVAATAGLILAAGVPAVYAATSATVVTDLNVRAGPGPQYPVLGVAARGSAAALEGCLEGSNWCRVNVGTVSGWAYAKYLAADAGGSTVVISERRAELGVPVVSYEATGSTVTVGPEPLELVGSVDEIQPIAPPPTVRTFITENPVDPVFLEGEVVLGATVPRSVAVRTIPDYEYEYVVVNNQPVLVEPSTRRIVYIYR
ncbi:uncharacterized protein YraI [Sinorhizobium kostiense]|uniref:Uncharacterized protein YraI n=1 Tax=Sinorhizobium kostiense TaxID=76747 RepID=A0ABS4R1H8_9HYPH|nr:DUF1236 domain-containing protein [Sinorhizobium kostiense]MBP2236758.1 uncharacterized protein YraI [Sinorhizobium kostiense]